MDMVRISKKRTVKVVDASERRDVISGNDIEMDKRAAQAVKSALEKAEFCKKPIAKYDIVARKAYIEYANGVKKYVN